MTSGTTVRPPSPYAERQEARTLANTCICNMRTPGWLARHLGIALLLIVVGLALLGFSAYELQTQGPLIHIDNQIAGNVKSMAENTPGPILEAETFAFFLGKENLQLLGAVLILYFLYKRYWAELGMVIIGWMGGSVIWNWMIYYFNRARPQEQVGIEVKTIPSFPSGHTMFTILALGLLGYLLVPIMPSRFWKWLTGLAMVLLILFVGAGRVLEGGHYLSDVLAGYGLGLAWGVLVYTLLEAISIRRRV